MKSVTQLRQSLGLSIRQLAKFLGNHTSLLHRVELGDRDFAPESGLNYARLLTAFHTMKTPSYKEEKTAEDVRKWSNHSMRCYIKAEELKKELQEAVELHANACRLYACLQQLKANSLHELKPAQIRWIEEMEYQSSNCKKKYGTIYQTELQISINLLLDESSQYDDAANER